MDETKKINANASHGDLTRMTINGREILLVGTAHVSKASVDLVEKMILEEKPDTVCVELCQSRYQSVMQKDQWREMDIIKVIREKKSFMLLASLMLAAFQKKIGEKLGVRPGQEMITAIETAKAQDAGICLADRDISVTLSRAWRHMSFWSRIKMLFQLLLSMGGVDDIEEKDIEQMKETDMLESVLAEVEKSHPELRRILIDERDQYLAQKIRTATGPKIVAVVGAGHVPGIRRHIEKDQDISALDVVPPKGNLGKVLKWLIPAIIVMLVAAGFFFGGAEAGKNMIIWWIAANGIFAGIGAILAFGHPLTILTAVLAAPITSMNPMIAAGWVAGLVEAFVKTPKVRDLENLSSDIMSVRGFWRNKATRVLLVVVFTNLGSSIGTFVALPMMMRVMGN
jgi:pheromone shutdown-related protein TraB